MPGQPRIFINGEFYHIYNRGINHQRTFVSQRDFKRAVLALDYYRYLRVAPGLGDYLRRDVFTQLVLRQQQEASGIKVEVLAYCFMPNHFHLLVRQVKDDGISQYLSQFENSITRFHNVAHGRDGALYRRPFKYFRIESESQLIQTARYIHRNPLVANLVLSEQELLTAYPWSSLPVYAIGSHTSFVNPEHILAYFDNSQEYLKHTFNSFSDSYFARHMPKLVLD